MRLLPNNKLAHVSYGSPKERQRQSLLGIQSGNFAPCLGPPLATPDSPCTLGRLSSTKEWFVTTPAVALLTDGKVNHAWEAKAPDLDTILSKVASSAEKGPFPKILVFHSFSHQRNNDTKHSNSYGFGERA